LQAKTAKETAKKFLCSILKKNAEKQGAFLGKKEKENKGFGAEENLRPGLRITKKP